MLSLTDEDTELAPPKINVKQDEIVDPAEPSTALAKGLQTVSSITRKRSREMATSVPDGLDASTDAGVARTDNVMPASPKVENSVPQSGPDTSASQRARAPAPAGEVEEEHEREREPGVTVEKRVSRKRSKLISGTATKRK